MWLQKIDCNNQSADNEDVGEKEDCDEDPDEEQSDGESDAENALFRNNKIPVLTYLWMFVFCCCVFYFFFFLSDVRDDKWLDFNGYPCSVVEA